MTRLAMRPAVPLSPKIPRGMCELEPRVYVFPYGGVEPCLALSLRLFQCDLQEEQAERIAEGEEDQDHHRDDDGHQSHHRQEL